MDEELRKYVDGAAANFVTVQGPGMPPGLGSLTKAFIRGAETVADYYSRKNADFEQKGQKIEQKGQKIEEKGQKIEQKLNILSKNAEKFNEFRLLVAEVRQTQKEYFRTRSGDVLRRSKALEKRLDEELRAAAEVGPGDSQLSIFGEGGQ